MTPERAAALKRIADAHDQWEAGWLTRAPYTPPENPPPGSVYNLHYLDVDPPAGAEDAFQALIADR